MPGRAQLGRDPVPRRRSEPRARHQYEVGHARNLAEGTDTAPGPVIGGSGTFPVRADRPLGVMPRFQPGVNQ